MRDYEYIVIERENRRTERSINKSRLNVDSVVSPKPNSQQS